MHNRPSERSPLLPPHLLGAIIGWNGGAFGLLILALAAGVVPQTWALLVGGFVLCNGMCFLVHGGAVVPASASAAAPSKGVPSLLSQFARLAVGIGVLLLVSSHVVAPRVEAMPEFDFVRWLPWRTPDVLSLGLIAVGTVVGAIAAVRSKPSASS